MDMTNVDMVQVEPVSNLEDFERQIEQFARTMDDDAIHMLFVQAVGSLPGVRHPRTGLTPCSKCWQVDFSLSVFGFRGETFEWTGPNNTTWFWDVDRANDLVKGRSDSYMTTDDFQPILNKHECDMRHVSQCLMSRIEKEPKVNEPGWNAETATLRPVIVANCDGYDMMIDGTHRLFLMAGCGVSRVPCSELTSYEIQTCLIARPSDSPQVLHEYAKKVLDRKMRSMTIEKRQEYIRRCLTILYITTTHPLEAIANAGLGA